MSFTVQNLNNRPSSYGLDKITFPFDVDDAYIVYSDAYNTGLTSTAIYVKSSTLVDNQGYTCDCKRGNGEELTSVIAAHLVNGFTDIFVMDAAAIALELYPPFWSISTGDSVDITPDNDPYIRQEIDNPTVYQLLDDYFNRPTAPFMDVDVYTEPPIVSVLWDNLSNIPAGMYPASFYVRLKIRDIDSDYPYYKIALCPYTMHEYTCDWRDMVNNMPAEPRDKVYADGSFNLEIELGYIDTDYTMDPDRLFVVNECIFNIDISDGTVTVEDTGDGNTCTPHTDTSPLTDQSFDDDTGATEDEDAGLSLSVDNLLTSSFKLTETDLNAIGADLWQNNWQTTLYENQVSPIENIISCKRLPFDVAASATSTHVYLGNHDTGVSAYRTAETSHSFDAGYITVPVYCNNFLDFTSNISIYLPYCGIHSIPTSLCYHQTLDSLTGLPKLAGNDLKVMYYYDILYGTCAAVLSVRKDNTQKWATFAVFNGTCGVDIPISQSSRASVQLAMDKAGDNMALGITCTLANAGLGAGAQLATGNYLGAALTAGNAAINAAQQKASFDIEKSHQQLHYTTAGGFSSQIASYLPASVVLLIDHARYNEPTTYKHENGYPCNLSLVLGNLEGYSELDGSIEISGINCLEEERAMLKQAFCEGFYMQKDPDPSLP